MTEVYVDWPSFGTFFAFGINVRATSGSRQLGEQPRSIRDLVRAERWDDNAQRMHKISQETPLKDLVAGHGGERAEVDAGRYPVK